MKAAGLWLIMQSFPFCAAAPTVPIFLVCYQWADGWQSGSQLLQRLNDVTT
jgi:hypothetical protein